MISRGLTLPQVKADAQGVIDIFRGRSQAAAETGLHRRHFDYLFSAKPTVSLPLLEMLYGPTGATLRDRWLPAELPAPPTPIAPSADPYGGLTVHQLAQLLEDDLDELTGALVSLKQLAGRYAVPMENAE